jgi:hypothetical protein
MVMVDAVEDVLDAGSPRTIRAQVVEPAMHRVFHPSEEDRSCDDQDEQHTRTESQLNGPEPETKQAATEKNGKWEGDMGAGQRLQNGTSEDPTTRVHTLAFHDRL